MEAKKIENKKDLEEAPFDLYLKTIDGRKIKLEWR